MIPKKRLGQHFLRCRWVVSTMIHAAELKPTDVVLEIGPGTGVLTRALARHTGRIVAVEKDERLAAMLGEALKKEGITNVEIVPGDILKLLKSNFRSYHKVVSNIPYYLTSRLLRLLFENEPRPILVALTIQREVAKRIVAKPPHMNLLALSVQAFGTPTIIKKVPASCFSPKPKIDSAIIKIADISNAFFQNNGLDKTQFFSILRRAFGNKRKTISKTLKLNFDQHPMLIQAAGIPEKARPEELSLENWKEVIKNYQ